jgi:hypothetical protein
MLIKVIRQDYTEGFVEDFLLEGMIKAGKIAAFRRSNGWVVVGSQPIREKKPKYLGPDRRKAVRRKNADGKAVRIGKGAGAHSNRSKKR